MIDLTPLDVRKKRGDFGKGLRGYDAQEVDAFLELVAERMEILVKENLAFRERIEELGQKLDVQTGREQAVQDALVTAQELRHDVKQQASREAKVLEREARVRIEATIGESEKLLTEHSTVLKELERHRDRFLKAFRTFLERELDTVEVELGTGAWSLGEYDDDADAAAYDVSTAETAEAVEAVEVAAAPGDPPAAESVAPEEEPGATEADEQQPPEGQEDGDSLWLSSIVMNRKEEDTE